MSGSGFNINVFLYIGAIFVHHHVQATTQTEHRMLSSINEIHKQEITTQHIFYNKRNVKFAYAFYATSDNHACGALVAAHKIQTLRAKSSNADTGTLINPSTIDVVVIYRDVSGIYIEKLFPSFDIIGIDSSTLDIDSENQATSMDTVKNDAYYEHSVDKLKIFKLVDYDRIIFLDVDSLIMKSLDHLFFLPPQIEVAAPWAYWENEPCLTSALLVITPNVETYNRMVAHWNGKIGTKSGPHADMDILNREFEHRLPNNKGRILPTTLMLPSNYLILSSDLIYPEPFHDQDSLFDTAYLFHFSAGGKPWDAQSPFATISERDQQLAHKNFYDIFDQWKSISGQVCATKHIMPLFPDTRFKEMYTLN